MHFFVSRNSSFPFALLEPRLLQAPLHAFLVLHSRHHVTSEEEFSVSSRSSVILAFLDFLASSSCPPSASPSRPCLLSSTSIVDLFFLPSFDCYRRSCASSVSCHHCASSKFMHTRQSRLKLHCAPQSLCAAVIEKLRTTLRKSRRCAVHARAERRHLHDELYIH